MAAMIWCPFPDTASARTVANTLLDEKLIACANILPAVESLFVWKGERGNASEVGLICKTDDKILIEAVDRLGALHPYDTPAVMGWVCDAANASARDWLGSLCGKG